MVDTNIVVVPCKECGSTGFEGDRIGFLEADNERLLSAINVAIACLTIDDDGGALDALHGAENGVRNKLEN